MTQRSPENSSQGFELHTFQGAWHKALATNSTNASALADIADIAGATLPEATGRHMLYRRNRLIILPYGTDANNETFSMDVWLWEPILNDAGAIGGWTPRLGGRYAVTLGSRTGVASGVLTTSHFYADTITATVDGTFGADDQVVSYAATVADLKAFVNIDTGGAWAAEFKFTNNSLTAASMNALYKAL